MAPVDPERLDRALERIEGTILPCVALMIDTLLDAAEHGETHVDPRSLGAELRSLAVQLEALTREIEASSPACAEAEPRPRAGAA